MLEDDRGLEPALVSGRAGRITCYTCHQGHAIPTNTPLLPAPNDPAEKKSETSLPPVSEVLSRYIDSLGGERNLRKVIPESSRRNRTFPPDLRGVIPLPAEVEIDQMVGTFAPAWPWQMA